MKLAAMKPRDSRIAALLLTLVALVIAYFALLHWWFVAPMLDVNAQMADLRDTQSRFAAAIAEKPQLEKRLAALGQGQATNSAFLPEDDPSDLADHWCIGLNEAGAQELWPYRESATAGRVRSLRVTCRLAMNSAAAAIDAAERGMGIVRPLSYQVERQIADGTLVAILPEYEPDPIPVHLIFQPRRFEGGALRAFIDFAVPILRKSVPGRTPPPSETIREIEANSQDKMSGMTAGMQLPPGMKLPF